MVLKVTRPNWTFILCLNTTKATRYLATPLLDQTDFTLSTIQMLGRSLSWSLIMSLWIRFLLRKCPTSTCTGDSNFCKSYSLSK